MDRRFNALRHGHTRNGRRSPEYLSWDAAKQRCTNKRDKDYASYGGRGIQFRFISFDQFFVTLGRRPTKLHQLDRIDNDGHYEPGNVRWATPSQQARSFKRGLGGRWIKTH